MSDKQHPLAKAFTYAQMHELFENGVKVEELWNFFPNYEEAMCKGDDMFTRYQYGAQGYDDMYAFVKLDSYTPDFLNSWWNRIKDKVTGM